jgi:glycosyltransferase involved in cell wall biosynthesis
MSMNRPLPARADSAIAERIPPARAPQPLKILMVTDYYPPFVGGVEILVSTVSRELVRRGHDVAVATLGADGLPATEVDEGVRVYRIGTTTGRHPRLFKSDTRMWAPPAPDPEAVAGLRRVLAREQPSIVHGHDWLARSYLPLKRRSGPPLVMSLHYFTLSCPKKSLLFEGSPCSGPALGKCLSCAGRHYGRVKGSVVVLAQQAFSRAERALVDVFLPVSEATAADNGLAAGDRRYLVIPNLVPPARDPAPHAHLLDQLPAERFLLFVGDLRPAKGIEVLLEAYRRLAAPPPLVLIGKTWPDTPDDLPPGVTVRRDWPNPAVREAMRRCLALTAPSLLPEPFGIVVAEALAAGRPVVASAVGGIPEVARHDAEGLLVPPGDVAALAEALGRIASDPRLSERLAANASRRSADYAPDVVLPRLEAAYAGVLDRRKRGRS